MNIRDQFHASVGNVAVLLMISACTSTITPSVPPSTQQMSPGGVGTSEVPTITPSAPSPASEAPLPGSMKGYELYSWQSNDEWYFTLITGTNRVKSLEEIQSGEDTVSTDGWVRISVKGVDAIKSVLGRLPQHEEVFWLSGQQLEQAETQTQPVTFPPQQIVDDIRQYCEQQGVALHTN